MVVKVFAPKIQVTLHKTVLRTSLGDGAPVAARFSSTARRIDLTPYLGEGSVVRTGKGVRDPAGTFYISVPDKPYSGTLIDNKDGSPPVGSAESLYGLVEPQDIIEIRMRHGVGSGQLPIVMRGFVSKVARSQGMTQGPDGKPFRGVTITGQDYGKLWQQLQINYLPGYVVGEDTLTAFKLFERYGVGFQAAMRAPDFVRTVVSAILDPYLQGIVQEESRLPRTIVMDEDQLVEHGTTSISGPQNKEGTIYDLLRTFGDVGAWNELFLEDREDGVFCVYRPNPFKRLDGSHVIEDATLPATVEIDDVDVSALNVERSDENVANYFWVRAPRFEFVNDALMRQDQALGAESDTVLLGKYQNTSTTLYGVKLMFLSSEMGGDDVETFSSGLPEAQKVARESLMANWQNYRRRQLVDSNKDNVVLESGSAQLRGNEAVRAGQYLRINRGKFSAEYYVANVQHTFVQFQSFQTSVMLERGTGFVERAKRGGGADSPFYAEMSKQ